MPADRVVKSLDVVAHIGSCLVSGPVGFALRPFGLERREEALHRRVVLDIAGTAHAVDNAVVGHQTLELLTGVLGGFKWSSQHRVCLLMATTRQTLLPALVFLGRALRAAATAEISSALWMLRSVPFGKY